MTRQYLFASIAGTCGTMLNISRAVEFRNVSLTTRCVHCSALEGRSSTAHNSPIVDIVTNRNLRHTTSRVGATSTATQ
jgi:hypothetical protein